MTAFDRFAAIRAFVVDLDGTTYLGGRAIPGAAEFLSFLHDTGLTHLFVTNNSSQSSETYVDKLRSLGLPAEDGQVLTSGEATAMWVSRKGYRRAYVVGTPSLEREIAAALDVVDRSPDCVIVGFDKTLTYHKLEAATRFIAGGAAFIATHPDIVCPTETGYIPDCGAISALLKAATGVSPVVIGKPEPLLLQMALVRLELKASEVAVIGDRLYTDIAMARRAGALAVLTLTGETTREMLNGCPEQPDVIVDDLGVLANALRSRTCIAQDGRINGW